jgi:predicted SAM-dependent methyltransferase
MAEVLRVLKPGRIHRIVVPDLEPLVRAYLKDLEAETIITTVRSSGSSSRRFADTRMRPVNRQRYVGGLRICCWEMRVPGARPINGCTIR